MGIELLQLHLGAGLLELLLELLGLVLAHALLDGLGSSHAGLRPQDSQAWRCRGGPALRVVPLSAFRPSPPVYHLVKGAGLRPQGFALPLTNGGALTVADKRPARKEMAA